MTTTAEKLRALKAQHGLANPDVAKLAGVSVKTVEGWLASPDAASHRVMAQRNLDLIQARLAKKRGRK